MNRSRFIYAPCVVLAALFMRLALTVGLAGEPPVGLELRKLKERRIAAEGIAIPRDAIRLFLYEGTPRSVSVRAQHIAVDYGRSGVLFDRATGEVARRVTIVDGWPEHRPDDFAPLPPREPKLVGPGVIYGRYREKPDVEIAAAVEFRGRTWEAVQPSNFLHGIDRDWREARERFASWNAILRKLNAESYVRVRGESERRFTTEDGLASNVVTHLAVADDTLWAACVDIYDPDKEAWGPGGLCRYDADADRWQRVGEIDGHPVRWVTLLQRIRDKLWVGFREGDGVAGDSVAYGMGLYPQHYRPKTTAIVLARLANGRWSTFARPPAPDPEARSRDDAAKQQPPTETPRELARVADRVLLFSQTYSRRLSGNWDVELDGCLSGVDVRTDEWRLFDLYDDFDADELMDFVAEDSEVLVTSNRGVHRWDEQAKAWRFLDPQCALKNLNLSAATPIGDELWIGYGKYSFGILGWQGISRYSEKTGQWSHTPAEEIGTACPVADIAPLPNGDVWVCFQRRGEMSAASEFSYYPRQPWNAPCGLGLYSNGKWKAPIAVEDLVEAPKERRRGWYETATQLVAVGDTLFLSWEGGVYAGPEPWKLIYEGQVTGIRPSADGKALEMLRRHPESKDNEITRYQQARYQPEHGEIIFEDQKASETELVWLFGRGGLLDALSNAAHRSLVPIREDGQTVVYFPASQVRRLVTTPAAYWVASQGELIRLDRKVIDGLLER